MSIAHYVARGALLTVPNVLIVKSVIDSGGIVAYWENSGKFVKLITIICSPTVVICGAGALESTVRSIVALITSQPDLMKKELKLANACLHGMLCVPLGMILTAVEPLSPKGERFLLHSSPNGAAPQALEPTSRRLLYSLMLRS